MNPSRHPERKHDRETSPGFQSASLLTRAELLDHARNPRNQGELPDADIVQEESNPLCGDVVTIYARVIASAVKQSQQTASAEEIASSPSAPRNDVRVEQMSFTGSGCIISQAAASMLTEFVRGKTVEEVLRLEREDIERMLGGGVSPSRVKCAMLSLVALKKGLGHSLSLRAKQSNLSGRDAEEITSSPASRAGSSQ